MDDQVGRIILRRRHQSDEDLLLHKRILGAMENLERWIGLLRSDLGELSKRLYNTDVCELLIRGVVYPGTVIKYRDVVLVVPTLMSHRKWIFRERGLMPPPEGIALMS